MLGKRRAFFFGITLSEIAFILFFALLLFSFYRFQADAEDIGNLGISIEECREQLRVINELQEQIRQALDDPEITPEEVIRRMTEVDRLTAEVIELDALAEKLQKELAGYSDIKAAIESASYDVASSEPSESPTERMKRALKLLEKLELWIRLVAPPGTFNSAAAAQQFALDTAEEKLRKFELPDGEFDPEETIDDVRQHLRDTQGQLQYCMNQLNTCKGGRDLPPCWVNEINPRKVDYLLEIDLHDDGLEIRPAPLMTRYDDFLRVPGASNLIGDRIVLEDFTTLAQPVLDHSNNLECRHYVIITDLSEISYKATLTIEDYFYKYVNKD